MSKEPRPGNEVRAQVRRYRAFLVRGPHPYVPTKARGGMNGLGPCARRLRQMSRANSPITVGRVRHPASLDTMIKYHVAGEAEMLAAERVAKSAKP